MFADIHSHVLCGIDDGAERLEETKQLLHTLHENGVTHLALTPHYYPYRRSISDFTERREKAFQKLLTLPEAEKFTFSLGAEVYLSETLLNNKTLGPLCYGGGNCMLTELEYADNLTDSARFRLLRLTEDFGVVPVLAHIDRYPFLWKDDGSLAWLRGIGCLFQVNLSAFIGFFSRKRALQLYDLGYVNFIGEDVHHQVLPANKREQIFSAVEKKRPEFLDRISRDAVRLLFPHS